jgi:uncharacterized RDD family membrane protein YckC
MGGLTTSGLTHHPTGSDSTVHEHPGVIGAVEPVLGATDAETTASEPSVYTKSDSWRLEVAARLERYRTRRKPRTPRYPSLLLPFDSPESRSRPAPPSGLAAVPTVTARAEQEFETQSNEEPTEVGPAVLAKSYPTAPQSQEQSSYQYPEQSAKVIEFPRSAAIPVFHATELADPIFDRPRIVEAPEILPPPPALGGMLIEPLDQESAERRADSTFASPSVSITRRALAALVDGVVLAASLTAFAAIVLRLNPSLNPVQGPLPLLSGALGGVAVVLWAGYEFLFVVYTGSTPGLRVARLQLAGFDGAPLIRRTRRWRVLASFLSAFSAGLGYLWCVLDQDGLCWHDRITRTHVTLTAKPEEGLVGRGAA